MLASGRRMGGLPGIHAACWAGLPPGAARPWAHRGADRRHRAAKRQRGKHGREGRTQQREQRAAPLGSPSAIERSWHCCLRHHREVRHGRVRHQRRGRCERRLLGVAVDDEAHAGGIVRVHRRWAVIGGGCRECARLALRRLVWRVVVRKAATVGGMVGGTLGGIAGSVAGPIGSIGGGFAGRAVGTTAGQALGNAMAWATGDHYGRPHCRAARRHQRPTLRARTGLHARRHNHHAADRDLHRRRRRYCWRCRCVTVPINHRNSRAFPSSVPSVPNPSP
jgi:hypothetical protein